MKYTVSAWTPRGDGYEASACLEIEGKLYMKKLWSGVYEKCAEDAEAAAKQRKRVEDRGAIDLARDAVWEELLKDGLARLPA